MEKGVLYNLGVLLITAALTCLVAVCVGLVYGAPLWGLFALLHWAIPAFPSIGYAGSSVIAATLVLLRALPRVNFKDFNLNKKE